MKAADICEHPRRTGHRGHSLTPRSMPSSEFCRARSWTLVEAYVRPRAFGPCQSRGLQRLLQQATEGRFDVVVVHAIRPASRDLQGCWRLQASARSWRVLPVHHETSTYHTMGQTGAGRAGHPARSTSTG